MATATARHLKIYAQDLKRGDMVVIPEGKGRHRGMAADDGVLEICTPAQSWGDFVDVVGLSLDLKPHGHFVPASQRFEVIRHG